VWPLPAPTVIGGEQHYEVESILDSRLKAGRENSWVSKHDVSVPQLTSQFYCNCHSTKEYISQVNGIYIFITHYNKFEDYEEILPILVPAHENNFTKSFEGEFEYAKHLPAPPRTV